MTDAPEVLNGRGLSLVAAGDAAGAVACYDQALAMRPDYADALTNRGNALLALDRIDAALADLRRTVVVRPDFAIGHFNLGRALAATNRIDETIACYDRVLALKPGDAEATWAKGTVQLLAGDYANGWVNYDSRWQSASFPDGPRNFGTPRWTGAGPLAGRTIFVHAEQGFGDTIQFCRYLPVLAARGARVLFMAQPELMSLLRASNLGCAFFVPGDGVPGFDFDIPLMTLPAALKTTLESVPATVPYLTPPPDKAAKWADLLGPRRRPRIGLAWSGRRTHPNDRHRSLPVEALSALLAEDAEFHVLQAEITSAERGFLDGRAQVFDIAPRDFGDAAAHTNAMDMIVSVDTSIAHLAGALAKPVLILLPVSPDFRWMLGRADSPWYPTARLIRQSRIGAWDDVMATAVNAIGSALGGAAPRAGGR